MAKLIMSLPLTHRIGQVYLVEYIQSINVKNRLFWSEGQAQAFANKHNGNIIVFKRC